jgi:hypothetical protein
MKRASLLRNAGLSAIFAAVLGMGFGCQEGPAEKQGKEIDEANRAVKKAEQETSDIGHPPTTGEKVNRAVDNATNPDKGTDATK